MHGLSVKIIAAPDLSERERSSWQTMRANNPALYSPYFHIDYVKSLASILSDVHILVIERGGAPIAFLPFQAKIGKSGAVGFARPAGTPMTDYHGLICARDTDIPLKDAMEMAGFGAFHYEALIEQQPFFGGAIRGEMACAVFDINEGPDIWRSSQSKSYRRHLKNDRKRRRKAESLGPRRTEFRCQDPDVFAQLFEWKREKFADSAKYDVLGAKWTGAFIRKLWDDANSVESGAANALRCEMHALFFGDDVAAIDLGLTDGHTFHSWMVGYNPQHASLAPGIQLLEDLINAAPELGYRRIDLGPGIDGYKRHYATQSVSVISGFTAVAGPAAALSRLVGAAETFGEERLGTPGKIPGRLRRRYVQISACEPRASARARAIAAAIGAGLTGKL